MTNIAQLRKEKGLRQSDLAQELGIDRSTVAKWETGEALPRVDKLIKISIFFGVPIESILKKER